MADFPGKDEETKRIGIPAADLRAEPDAENTALPPRELINALRRVGVFADLPEDQLEWFVKNSEERILETGDAFYHKGDAPDWMTVFLEGEVHYRRDAQNLDGYIYIARAGDAATEVSGKLPFSRMKMMFGDERAAVRTRVLLFPAALFPQLVERMPVLAERLVWLMIDRTREDTRLGERRDKLTALGKLSAGLAHELNNPAAAARRSADEMSAMLEELRVADLNLRRHDLTREQRELIADLEREAITTAAAFSSNVNALAMSDREEELIEWLAAHNIANAWHSAQTLSEAGVDVHKLEQISAKIQSAALKDFLTRVAAHVSVARLAYEIKISAARISDLIAAIKEYSYMDTAVVKQEIDLHKGLENTLLILKYKLNKKNISVVREYEEDLPPLTAYGSLLNQVWTNLIDNAIDAMPEGGGQLKIRTKLEPDTVLIEIRDNGAGIPIEVQPHIFEPFYTTKGIGEGTGLGLDAVTRIVRRHQGNLRFETKPGDTCFQVRLPTEKKSAAII